MVESLNNSPIRHTAFGIWIAEVLERGMAKGDAAVPGIVQPEVVAARARGLDPARLAIMPDDRVAHADNDKHKADSMVLSREQYKGLAAGFARPEAVYWDARHNNALYVLPDPDLEWCVVLPLYMPSNNKSAVKKLGRFDGVATTYRTRRDALLGRILEKIR